ncbi:hypothetical protein KSS87_004895, partial [Heliosperma pusillum]
FKSNYRRPPVAGTWKLKQAIPICLNVGLTWSE